MKFEVGSFSANSSTATVLLNDGTLNVKGLFFSVTPTTTGSAEHSSGFDDSSTHRAESTLVDSTKHESYRSNAYGITHYRNVSGTTTRKLAGYVTDLSTAGQFSMNFDNYDASLVIDFVAYGD